MYFSLVRDTAGEDPVKGTDAIGTDQQKCVTKVKNVPDLSASYGQVVNFCFEYGERPGKSFLAWGLPVPSVSRQIGSCLLSNERWRQYTSLTTPVD